MKILLQQYEIKEGTRNYRWVLLMNVIINGLAGQVVRHPNERDARRTTTRTGDADKEDPSDPSTVLSGLLEKFYAERTELMESTARNQPWTTETMESSKASPQAQGWRTLGSCTLLHVVFPASARQQTLRR